ncbi:MAG: SDR family oxidoreductase [Anaerolineales bacterium]|jgi:NAD(P)-dependent dehydrogenase (short-subunit alcohol dehydrogenase family)
MGLRGKNILITGAAARIGKAMAFAVADVGANVIIHYWTSKDAAQKTQSELKAKGVDAYILQADLNDLQSVPTIIERSLAYGPIFALVNNASIFENKVFTNVDLDAWNRHMNVNLTTPFLLSQSFANSIGKNMQGRIVNILDWRAARPGDDHLPYTISKAGLAALTRSTAISLAPQITVNGIALGAILPPSDGGNIDHITNDIPMSRWANLNEVGETLLFLLDGPSYITGEIIHLDGGRHLI